MPPPPSLPWCIFDLLDFVTLSIEDAQRRQLFPDFG
jgi:hypothetical protein